MIWSLDIIIWKYETACQLQWMHCVDYFNARCFPPFKVHQTWVHCGSLVWLSNKNAIAATADALNCTGVAYMYIIYFTVYTPARVYYNMPTYYTYIQGTAFLCVQRCIDSYSLIIIVYCIVLEQSIELYFVFLVLKQLRTTRVVFASPQNRWDFNYFVRRHCTTPDFPIRSTSHYLV